MSGSAYILKLITFIHGLLAAAQIQARANSEQLTNAILEMNVKLDWLRARYGLLQTTVLEESAAILHRVETVEREIVTTTVKVGDILCESLQMQEELLQLVRFT